jgi:uncharacterized protein (DUF924 family)
MTGDPPTSATKILDFWFSDSAKALWFNSTPAFDEEVHERFESLYQRAKGGQLDAWCDNAEGALAVCIVLDQFPLNMYRGRAESFAGESKARSVAKLAIDSGFDKNTSIDKRAFYYLPFMHSENMADQNYSVTLFEQAGLTENLVYAKHHRDIIKRFGRFPHRNKILNRTSTPQEQEYLASRDGYKG